MGFIKYILNDITSLGSLNTQYKRKFTEVFKILSYYSFGELQFSDNVARQRILAGYAELEDIAKRFSNPNEHILLYFTHGTIETTIKISLEVMRNLINSCFENGTRMTPYAVSNGFRLFQY